MWACEHDVWCACQFLSFLCQGRIELFYTHLPHEPLSQTIRSNPLLNADDMTNHIPSQAAPLPSSHNDLTHTDTCTEDIPDMNYRQLSFFEQDFADCKKQNESFLGNYGQSTHRN